MFGLTFTSKSLILSLQPYSVQLILFHFFFLSFLVPVLARLDVILIILICQIQINHEPNLLVYYNAKIFSSLNVYIVVCACNYFMFQLKGIFVLQ